MDYTKGPLGRAILLLAVPMMLELGVGTTGVYWSVVIAESLAGLVGIVLFRRGGWKEARV